MKNEILDPINRRSDKILEREHLQERLADNPESLGEELLIIQKIDMNDKRKDNNR